MEIILDTVKAVFQRSGVADRSQIHTDEKGDLYLIVNGQKQSYPKPLDVERRK